MSPGDVYGNIPIRYIMKATDRRTGSQIWPIDLQEERELSGGCQRVADHSLHAFDNEFAYFVWAQIGPHSQDVMMLLDTGASISIIPRSLWLELNADLNIELRPAQVEIAVGNGGQLGTDGVATPSVPSCPPFPTAISTCAGRNSMFKSALSSSHKLRGIMEIDAPVSNSIITSCECGPI